MKYNKKIVIHAFFLALVMSIMPTTVSAHGWIENSRSHLCSKGQNSGCGGVQYEPQSVEGPKGFPDAGPADGKIANAGLGRFTQLNEQTPTRWTKKSISSGQNDFSWTFTANHSTSSFRYFITKPDWNPSLPLSRDALDLTPFCQFQGGNQRPPSPLVHSCNVPSGRNGYHIILGVWDIADTSMAFYQVIDVNFDGVNPPTAPWTDVGDIQPTADLGLGDRVFTRAFAANDEINDPSLETSFTIENNEDGNRLMWPLRLAELINQEQSELQAGIRNQNGIVTPVSGKNDIFAKPGSDITRVEIDIEAAPPQEPFLALNDVANEYTISDPDSITLNVEVIAEPDHTLMIQIFNANNDPVAVVNSDSEISQHSLTIDNPTAGTYTLVVKLMSGSDFVKQVSATFDLLASQPPAVEYDYVYPNSKSAYKAGTRVLNGDGVIYECKPWPYSGWCRGAGSYFAPGTGLAWSQAWVLVGRLPGYVAPPPSADQVYPQGKGSYQNGDSVEGTDGKIYKCLIPGWCNGSSFYYAPGTGLAWSQAWQLSK